MLGFVQTPHHVKQSGAVNSRCAALGLSRADDKAGADAMTSPNVSDSGRSTAELELAHALSAEWPIGRCERSSSSCTPNLEVENGELVTPQTTDSMNK